MIKQRKIGIMGGTFNPIHQGHLLLAEAAREECGLDEILFMPSGHPYMKNESEIADNKTRIDMTALAIEDNAAFALSTIETEREGATYTCETLAVLNERHPEIKFYFIMGADSLFTIETWKNPQEIFDGCELIEIRQKAADLEEKYHAKIHLISERIIDISSSEIRSRIQENKSVRYMVPEKVFSYINKHKLYQKEAD